VADDAGALLVRSGLVSSNALDDARARVVSLGGTLGEQLVTNGAITDDALTTFYRSRLLVPQVNPNMLARLTPKVVGMLPGDMAIELRAIPVSIDADNNLTVAMSDPSDRHAVDEIAFFTGAYVVRAVATQMQIAWCLAHYYGHVTVLGQRLLHPSERDAASPIKAAVASAAQRVPRTKGLTGKVNASRHRAIAPITGPVDLVRPSGKELDVAGASKASLPSTATSLPQTPATTPRGSALSPPAKTIPHAGVPSASSPAIMPGGVIAPPIVPIPLPVPPSVAASSIAPPSLPAKLATPPSPPSLGRPDATPPGLSGDKRRAPTPIPTSAPPSSASTIAKLAPVTTAGVAEPPSRPSSPPARTAGVAEPPSRPSSPPSALATTAGVAEPPSRPSSPPSALSPPSAPGAAPPAIGAAPPPIGAAPPAISPAPVLPTPSFNAPVPRAAPDAQTIPPRNDDGGAVPSEALARTEDSEPVTIIEAAPTPDAVEGGGVSSDGAPDRPRARSVSGEIRVPVRRAPSIRPPLPSLDHDDGDDDDDDDDEPLIVIEQNTSEDDATGPRMMPVRRRAVKSDPPELRARAGEVDLKTTGDHEIVDEPRIVIDEDALAPETAPIDTRGRRDGAPITTIDVSDDADTGAVIHDRVVERTVDAESQPILLDRPRATPDPLQQGRATIPEFSVPDDDDTGETDIVVLEARKPARPERRTQVGVPPAPVQVRPLHRPDAPAGTSGAIPMLIDRETERTTETDEIDDPTALDLRAAPPGDETTSEQLAVPPGPASDLDTNPFVIAPPPAPSPPRAAIRPAMIVDEDEDEDDDEDDDSDPDIEIDDDDEPRGPRTSEMTAAELDDAIPERTSEFDLNLLARRRIEYDPVDDGWGPPGTTIPPPLLGAIPGSELDDDEDESTGTIPMPNFDSSPLLVAPTSGGDPSGPSLVRQLEDTTARAIEVIRELEHAHSRDEVVEVMIAYLAETHHRAGFFVTRHTATAIELGMFAMTPRPAVIPFATLRLDRPSTLQDVVGTRLPYRGPMHDDTSRGFLVSVLGACPAEILLVPVAVRERVVGVLFGEHRRRHTFDDQLALAARAAGMALERILRAKRG
jgi:Type II secretion system (T2SS), protein E, N-terminal domain